MNEFDKLLARADRLDSARTRLLRHVERLEAELVALKDTLASVTAKRAELTKQITSYAAQRFFERRGNAGLG